MSKKYLKWQKKLEKIQEAYINGLKVRTFGGKTAVIRKIDPASQEYTVLLRFKDRTLKWVNLNWIMGILEPTEESA